MRMDRIKKIIIEVLELVEQELSDDDGRDTIEKWDSLGHLSILSALDNEFDGKAASIESLAEAKTVREIVQILEKENLL